MKKVKIFVTTFLVFILILYLNPNTLRANSPPLVMHGDTAFPINSDNIRLESEVIKIHYGASSSVYSHLNDVLVGHEIEVIFNFYNTGPDAEIDIGFPNTANYGEKLRNFQAFDYPSMIPYETEIKVGGSLPEHDEYFYNSMYVWKMHFKEGEKKSVYVKYEFESHGFGADYILVTGALWKNRIDKIDVYVDFPKPAAYAQIVASPGDYHYNGEGIEWHFENIEPDFNLFVGLLDFPDYYEKTDYYMKKDYLGKNHEYYKPRVHNPLDTYKWDDYFYFIDLLVSYEYTGSYPLYLSDDIEYVRETVSRIKDTNQFVINEIYARHGYDFETKEWEEIFEEAEWYVHNSEFSPDEFNYMEQTTIAYIKCFERTVVTDGSDEQLLQSLKEFHEKYNGNDMCYYAGDVYPYYQYTYELVSKEKERVIWIDEINEECINEWRDERESVNISASGDDRNSEPLEVFDLPDDRQLELHNNGIFVRDNENTRCIFKYRTFWQTTGGGAAFDYRKPLSTYPQIYDRISASPSGKYLITGINYQLDEISDIVGNRLYIIPIDDNSGSKSCISLRGDFDDFNIWWSPSENIICWQNVKKEPNKLVIHNMLEDNSKECELPYDRITSFYATDDGKIVLQMRDTIYYINSSIGDDAKDETDGNDNVNENIAIYSTKGNITAVLDEGIYFYRCSDRSSDIYYTTCDEIEPIKINKVDHSIWKSKTYSDNLHLYYGGAYNLSVFNVMSNKLNSYKFDDYHGQIKPSPEGDRLFIYRNYENPTAGKQIRGAIVLIAGEAEAIIIDGADNTTEWLDNDNLLVKVYNEKYTPELPPIAEYRYNVITKERVLIDADIESFTSRAVNEFRTGGENLTYESRKRYSQLKNELEANAFTILENTVVYGDNGLLYQQNIIPYKGSLIGILEKGVEGSKVCYFNDNNFLRTGWIRNTDYSTDVNFVELTQGFIYDAVVYEFDGEKPRKIFDSCSSQVRILEKKPGWVYINAVDRIFGWVEEGEIKFGFPVGANLN